MRGERLRSWRLWHSGPGNERDVVTRLLLFSLDWRDLIGSLPALLRPLRGSLRVVHVLGGRAGVGLSVRLVIRLLELRRWRMRIERSVLRR